MKNLYAFGRHNIMSASFIIEDFLLETILSSLLSSFRMASCSNSWSFVNVHINLNCIINFYFIFFNGLYFDSMRIAASQGLVEA